VPAHKDQAVAHDVDEYLQEWEEHRERGESVSAMDLCPDWPEGRAELSRLIGLLEACDRLLHVEEPSSATAEQTTAPAVVAGYEVRGELGRGGMGVVYRVWDPMLRREAALKMLQPTGLAALPDAAAHLTLRFQQEAQVLAQLKHEHIVPVFQAQVDEGRPYFVMECIDGGSLTQRIPEMTAAGPSVIVPFMEKVARAVHHAHDQGVLHRDLKPGNILLEWRPEDRTPIPRISDFGLAKLLSTVGDAEADESVGGIRPFPATGSAPMTAPGFQPGTPAYMAPEQFDSSFGTISPATDVWALGVILYELLTGQKPFQGDTREELRKRVCRGTPPRPRCVRRTVDRRLEAIVLHCLEMEPSRRFRSASELADALHRCVERPRWRRWVAAVCLGAAALAPLPVSMLWPKREAGPEELEQRAEKLYREAVGRFQSELAQGQPVTLIGPTTRELAYRWRAGDGKINYSDDPEEAGAVSIKAVPPSLLELFPDPPMRSYAIVAELRQDKPLRANRAEVSIAFACNRHITEEGTHWIFARTRFADLGELAQVYKNKAGEPSSMFQLGFAYLGTTSKEVSRTQHWGVSGTLYSPMDPNRGPGPWRRIRIEVRPDRYGATWEGRTFEMAPAIELSRALDTWRITYAELKGANPGPPDRGAIGIYLEDCAVSIRRFRIEPISE